MAAIARLIQERIQATPTLQKYALDLWKATREPTVFGIKIDGVDMNRLVLAGGSARGMSMMMRTARVSAWLEGREHLIPEDLQRVFRETVAHRIFFSPVYEMRRTEIIGALMDGILNRVAAP